MAFATGRSHGPAGAAHPFDLENIQTMLRAYLRRARRFSTMAMRSWLPGLTLHRVGGHSAGLQIVRVWTRARMGGGRVRRGTSVREFRAAPAVSDRLQHRGNAGGVQSAVPAGGFARSHRAGARSAGDEILSGGQAGAGGNCRAARCAAERAKKTLSRVRQRSARSTEKSTRRPIAARLRGATAAVSHEATLR